MNSLSSAVVVKHAIFYRERGSQLSHRQEKDNHQPCFFWGGPFFLSLRLYLASWETSCFWVFAMTAI